MIEVEIGPAEIGGYGWKIVTDLDATGYGTQWALMGWSWDAVSAIKEARQVAQHFNEWYWSQRQMELDYESIL